MPTVTLNRTVFEKLLGKKLTETQLKDRIAMIGTDLEILTEKEIIVEVFPNRPDMLSEQGFSRAFRSFLGVETGLRQYALKKSGYKVVVDSSVTMRPYTACAIVKNLQFTDEKIRELMQVQEKLATTHGRNRKKSAYGIYPLSAITFPIRYVAKDPNHVQFRPLGFERTIPASQVVDLHPKGKEYKHLSEGWKKFPFFIDANNHVLSMLPFTNSEDTGKVDSATHDVFIECTGIDLCNVQIALNILVTMLADMGGEIYSLDIEYSDRSITTPHLEPRKMHLDISYVQKILGVSLTKAEIKKYLEQMGYDVKGDDILVPAYRADILHQRDLVEDIAIAYGYENVAEEIPVVATIAQEDPFEVFKSKIADLLVGLGLLEVSNYHLIDKKIQTTSMNVSLDLLEILDPVSEGYDSLRAWILPCLLQTLRENKTHEYPQRLFEIGTIFHKNLERSTLSDEFVSLGIVLAHPKANFTEARQILDYLLRMFEVEYTAIEAEQGCFLPGRCGKAVQKDSKKNEHIVASLGELHPQVLENFGLEMPVAVLELNLSVLWEMVKEK